MNGDVQMIPIDQIRILNPRVRDKKKFEKIVQSIQALGLKKPIKVSPRGKSADGYDLICGQGRIEAFVVLGYREIPALVVEATEEDRLLMSLIENMARRSASPFDLINEIERLKVQGYSNTAIGQKLGLHDAYIGDLILLKNAGEERVLDEALRGRIPLGVAIDIAKATTQEMQQELLKGYESKQLNQASIRRLKRLLDQRRFLGKTKGRGIGKREKITADGMVNALRKESLRQKVMIRKARVCEAKLVFLVTAFKRLLADENFVTLLRAESHVSMPKCLSEIMHGELKEAA